MRSIVCLLIIAICEAAGAAPSHYRIIAEGGQGPIALTESGDVVFPTFPDGLSRWSNGTISKIVAPNQTLDGMPVRIYEQWGLNWCAAGDGTVFYPSRAGPVPGLFVQALGKPAAWWLKGGDEIPGAGHFTDFVAWGFAAAHSNLAFATVNTDLATWNPEGYVVGSVALVAIAGDASPRGRRIDLLAQSGDPTPDGNDVFVADLFGENLFQGMLADDHGQLIFNTHVRGKPVFSDPWGRETLWRWTRSGGLHRLLDPAVPLASGWKPTPIFNAWMSPGGVYGTFAMLAKEGSQSHRAILMFDGAEDVVPRIAVQEGEELPEGRLSRLNLFSVNDAGSIAFLADIIAPGETIARTLLYHRSAGGKTTLICSPKDCADGSTCFIVPQMSQPVLTQDEIVYFNGQSAVGGFGLYSFNTRGGKLERIIDERWSDRFYPVSIGGATRYNWRAFNKNNRIALGDSYSIAIFDPAIHDCPADLTRDGMIDFGDFYRFEDQYHVMDCADESYMRNGCDADFNSDGYIDDADFALFAEAYDALQCPL